VGEAALYAADRARPCCKFGLLPVHIRWRMRACTHVACHMLYTVCLSLGCMSLLAFCTLHAVWLSILRTSIHVRAQRTLTSRSSGAVLVRRVHLRHSPARPERTAYVYIFNADSQVRPHAAILAPPPACACLLSSRRQPMHPRRPLACAHTVGHSCFSASAFRLPIRLDCMRSVCRGM
jgi:hypothetical protein